MISSIKETVSQRLPVWQRTIDSQGPMLVADYVAAMRKWSRSKQKTKPLQPTQDLLEAVSGYVSPRLGSEVAMQLTREIGESLLIQTANHHGVDFFGQAVQGNILFLLNSAGQCSSAATVPVFSCGSISTSNSSYPRGMLIYDSKLIKNDELPVRIPVFPDGWSQKMVCAAPPFTKEMATAVLKRLEKCINSQWISASVAGTAREVLHSCYFDEFILNQPDYSSQAMIINHRIGKSMFSGPDRKPEIVYMELEHIAASLLLKDLHDNDSLIYRVFFDSQLRHKLTAILDGARGCWHQAKLNDLLNEGLSLFDRLSLSSGSGTSFFWGVDTKGRRFPLFLSDSSKGTPKLVGRDRAGKLWEYLFDPAELRNYLMQEQMYPSLFTAYLVISLARGIACVGGYFQSEYLPQIQRGLVAALSDTSGYENYVEPVSFIPTDYYLSGMMGILVKTGPYTAVPAGPLEIISRGGINDRYLQNLHQLTVEQAHRMGLFMSYPDITGRDERKPGWQESLALEYDQYSAFILDNWQ